MFDFTTLDREVRSKLEKNYFLGNILEFHAFREHGWAGRLYYVDSTNGRFIFKILSANIKEDQAQIIYQVLNFLEEHNKSLPIMRVLPSKESVFIPFKVGDQVRLGMLYSYIPVNFWPKWEIEDDIFHEIIPFIFLLQKELSKLDLPEAKFIDKKEFFLFADWWGDLRGFMSKFFPNSDLQCFDNIVSRLTSQSLIHTQSVISSLELPRQLVHADLKRLNFLFFDGHFSGLVDFDNIHFGFLSSDWAKFMESWTGRGTNISQWDDLFLLVKNYSEDQESLFYDSDYLKLRTLQRYMYSSLSFLDAWSRNLWQGIGEYCGRLIQENLEVIRKIE